MIKHALVKSLLLASFLSLGACFFDDDSKGSNTSVSLSSSSVLSSSSSDSIQDFEFQRIAFKPYYVEEPADSLLDRFNHIIWFSLLPTLEGGLDSGYVDGKQLMDFVQKAKSKNIKVSISIGGWNQSDQFPLFANSPEKRLKFAQEITAYAVGKGLSGIDLDWEFPDTTLGEGENYRDLIRAIRKESKPKGLHLGVNVHRVTRHFADLSPEDLDWIQIMSYDQSAGTRNGYVSTGKNGNYEESLQHLEYWQSVGFKPSQIVLGMPAYGVTLKDGTPIKTEAWGNLPLVDPNADSVLVKDQWYYNKEGVEVFGDRMYFGNGAGSVAKKVKHLKMNGFRGYMFWEISQDAPGEHSLFEAAYKASIP